MVFNFRARSFNTSRRPDCPRCGKPQLERQVSRFAISKNRPEKTESDEESPLPPGFDEARFEQALEQLAREADTLDEDNPRHMAHLMRRLFSSTGMEIDGRMEEALRRMESGEDPEAIEEEFGDLFDEQGDLPFKFGESKASTVRSLARKLRPPRVDETLYDLD